MNVSLPSLSFVLPRFCDFVTCPSPSKTLATHLRVMFPSVMPITVASNQGALICPSLINILKGQELLLVLQDRFLHWGTSKTTKGQRINWPCSVSQCKQSHLARETAFPSKAFFQQEQFISNFGQVFWLCANFPHCPSNATSWCCQIDLTEFRRNQTLLNSKIKI